MTYERNEKGDLLLDIEEIAAKAAGDRFTRYNGGWVKHVTGINKNITTGYSLLGEFCKEGKTWHSPGIYIDCGIGGSRKSRERFFTLFILKKDGSYEVKGDLWKYRGDSGGDWAVEYWSTIEDILKHPEYLESAESEEEKYEAMKSRAVVLVHTFDVLRNMGFVTPQGHLIAVIQMGDEIVEIEMTVTKKPMKPEGERPDETV